jgi:hypothetical protein
MADPLPVAFSPDEREEIAREDLHPDALPSIDAEIARTEHPVARAALEAERARVSEVQQAAAKPSTPPPTWDEVTKLPQMQALPFDQLEAARHQYFLDVVAPKVPTQDLDAARAAFDADTKPGILNEAISRLNDLLPKKPVVDAPAADFESGGEPDVPVSDEQAQANRERAGRPARMTLTRTGQPILEGGRVVPPAAEGETGKETAPFLESVKAAPKLLQLGTVQAIPQLARQYQELDQRIEDATAARDTLAKRQAEGAPYTPPDYNVRMEVGPRSPALSPEEKLHQARIMNTPADSVGSYDTEISGLDTQIKSLTEQRDHYAKVSELVAKDIQAATPKDQGMGGKMVTTAAQSAGPMLLGAATRSPAVGAIPGTAVQGAQAYEQTLQAGEDAKKRLPEFSSAPDKLKYIQGIAENQDADDTTRKAATNVLQAIADNAEQRRGGVLSSESEARENAQAVEKFGEDLKFIAQHATIRNAKLNAGLQMVAEYVGEKLGLGAILKPGSALLPKLTESLATNFGQEFATQAMQSLTQRAIYDPTVTLKDALEQMVIAGGAGAVTAGPLTIGAHVIEKAIDYASGRKPTPAAPGPGQPPKKPAADLPTVGELLGGAPAVDESVSSSSGEPEKTDTPDRISTINGLLGTVASSLSKAQEAGDEKQVAHYQGRAKELIAERAALEQQQNPDVDAQALQRQNRDRTRAASVAQMQSIANAPDYDRLGTAPIPDVGAPMVSVKGDEALPAADLGKSAVVTLADGTKMPVRYAVVEADSVLASNDVNGKENPGYFGDVPKGQLVAMTNGRVAGVQGAYARGTADAYKEAMAADPEHGVSAEAIQAKKRPMLVRVYDDAYNALPRLAQLSNTGGSAQLSDTEKARNDAAALDSLDGFTPTESGDVTAAANMPFVRRFVQTIPENERPEMLTATGELSQAGAKRLRAAVFAKAYGAGDALQRMVESTDDNVRAITAGLMRAAPAVARLREKVAAGALHDLDITPELLRAVEDFARLKAEGMSVGAWLAQADMFGALPKEIEALMGMLEDNARSGRRIAEFLERYLAAAEAAGNPSQGGMFETTTPGKADIVRGVRKEMGDERRAEGLREGARPAAAPAGGAAQAGEGAGAPAVPGPRAADAEGAATEGGERAPVDSALSDELDQALSDLGGWVENNLAGVAKMIPDGAEENLVPILSRLFAVAIKKGYRDFASASKFVMGEIRKKAAQLADLINDALLQRALRSGERDTEPRGRFGRERLGIRQLAERQLGVVGRDPGLRGGLENLASPGAVFELDQPGDPEVGVRGSHQDFHFRGHRRHLQTNYNAGDGRRRAAARAGARRGGDHRQAPDRDSQGDRRQGRAGPREGPRSPRREAPHPARADDQRLRGRTPRGAEQEGHAGRPGRARGARRVPRRGLHDRPADDRVSGHPSAAAPRQPHERRGPDRPGARVRGPGPGARCLRRDQEPADRQPDAGAGRQGEGDAAGLRRRLARLRGRPTPPW